MKRNYNSNTADENDSLTVESKKINKKSHHKTILRENEIRFEVYCNAHLEKTNDMVIIDTSFILEKTITTSPGFYVTLQYN